MSEVLGMAEELPDELPDSDDGALASDSTIDATTECPECLGPNGHLPLCPNNPVRLKATADHLPEECTPKCFEGQPKTIVPARDTEPKNKGGRPKGFDGTRSKANSHVAQAFKRVGLDWREDLAKAIMRNDRYRIKLWLKLLPHLIVSSRKSKVKRWKGKPSKAALIALETLEGGNE